MKFNNAAAEIFFPLSEELLKKEASKKEPSNQAPPPSLEILCKTTDLCIAAHPDDIEIMAYAPIAACYNNPTRRFTGVIANHGAGSPRSGFYENFTDAEMAQTRTAEQKTAATILRCFVKIFMYTTNLTLTGYRL